MSQLTTVESLPQSSDGHLQPAIQAALSCLDVNLEEELARYRRNRPVKKMPSTGTGRTQGLKTLNSLAVKAIDSTREAQQSLPAVAATDRSAVLEPSQNEGVDGAELAYGTRASNASATNEDNVESLPSKSARAAVPIGGSSANSVATQMEPDDYLESSETLLKNLAAEDQEGSSTKSHFTPLGIGLILLLFLATAIWGYVALNPSSVSHLPVNRLFKPQTPPVAQSPANSRAATSNTKRAAEIPNSPNLADREFEELTLRSLSTVKPRFSSTVPASVPPKPQVPVNTPPPLPPPTAGGPIGLSRSLLPQPFKAGVAPLPLPNETPQPTPTSANERATGATKLTLVAPATKGGAAKENKFLVVAAYTGDRSLARVRQVVTNAYVRRSPQGTSIQIAAFPDGSGAQQKVRELKQKGISARVIRR